MAAVSTVALSTVAGMAGHGTVDGMAGMAGMADGTVGTAGVGADGAGVGAAAVGVAGGGAHHGHGSAGTRRAITTIPTTTRITAIRTTRTRTGGMTDITVDMGTVTGRLHRRLLRDRHHPMLRLRRKRTLRRGQDPAAQPSRPDIAERNCGAGSSPRRFAFVMRRSVFQHHLALVRRTAERFESAGERVEIDHI